MTVLLFFYYRYVDDTLICVKKQYIVTVIKVFNVYDINLKFIYELVGNNKINFLDMTLIRTYSKILTNWYQKPTSSGRVFNYFSNHPIQQKKNIIVEEIFWTSTNECYRRKFTLFLPTFRE